MNFKDLTYKQKNRYLLIGTLVFVLVAYFTTIRNTIQLYQDNKRLKERIIRAENAPAGIAELRISLDGLNEKLNNYLIDTTREQEHTLEVVSEFCHRKNLKVKELPQRKVTDENDFTIVTSVLKIEGNYNNLLRLIQELEYEQKLGRLSSVSWRSYIDNKTKRTILYMTVYLQNITVNINHKKNEKAL